MNHILILIFAVVGVSLWGISEFLLTAEEESRESAAESALVVTETKRILIDRAIRPPPPAVADVANCGLQPEEGCYNYYNASPPAYIKHAPFTLPCPDLTTDGNLDGASDPGPNGCSSRIAGALGTSPETINGTQATLNHRLGRIPWRDHRAPGQYARGLGNRDLRDGAAARLWYAVARNIAPCVVQNQRDARCPFHPQTSAARNAAALLAMTTGWLSVVTQDDDGNQIILSDRVAAVVISPGAPNGGQSRPDEDILNAGTGANLPSLPAIAVAQNYLEGENADGDDIFFAYGQHPISLQIGERADSGANPTRRSEDHLEYITIDELAAAFAQSEQAPDYQTDIAELLDGYYNRVGHYPDPAVFHRKSGGEKLRPAGPPPTSPETIAGEQVLIRSATGADNVISIALRVADLPPVYLAPGWRFPDRAGNFDDETTFPFNESLAKMNTRFSDAPLEGLAGANNYEALYENNAHAVATNDLYGLSALEIGEATTDATAPVFNFIARAPELLAAPGENLRVILAAPLAINSTAVAVAQFPNDDSTPPDGADIILPAGTELEIAVGDQTYARFPSGLQIRGRRYRATLAAEPLTSGALGSLYPELDIPVRVRGAIISFVDVNSPAGELTFDQNGQLGGVGPQNGWMRGRTPDGIISRYEFRPVFSLLGGITNLSFDDTGYLSEADRMANNNVGHSAHAIVLSSIQIRDPGDYPGVGIRPRHLRATMQVVNPQAWHFGGGSHADVTPRDLDHLGPSGINDHLSDYYLLGPQFPNARRRLIGGVGNFSGRPIQINFQRVPFSQVLIHPNPGGGQLSAPQCEPTHCPYSIGFFADEIIIGVVPNNAAINAELRVGETSGVELTEQTLLPARLIDKSNSALVSLIRAAPSASETVAGRMGFVPAAPAAASMDPRFHTLATLARINSFNGNAAARLYFPLTMASRLNRQLIPFPPPGRPALRAAFPNGPDSNLESNLRPLPHPIPVPSGAAVAMPVGTQIVVPTITTALNLGRNFTFPDGAVALLPPGANVPASLSAGHVLPNGMQIPALSAEGEVRIVSLPHGGALPLHGSRFIAGGGKYDEMLELEIRGAAAGMNPEGEIVNLGDGSIVQPFTRRALSPNRVQIENGSEISGASRIRGRFLSRPQTAMRTGEPNEPSYPLKLGSAEAASQSFAAGSFNFENHDAAGALNLAFDEDTEFTLPPNSAMTVDIGMWPNILSPLPLAALRFFAIATSPQATPDAASRITYEALEDALLAWIARGAAYYAPVAARTSAPGFASNVRALAIELGVNPCEHLAPDRPGFVFPGGEREWVDCIFRQVPQNPQTPSALSFGAAELDSTGNYHIADNIARQESALTLTLPNGTRIYDKRFQGGRALVAAFNLNLPLAANLGGPDPLVFNNGLARFHFALFPENDIILRRPGGEKIIVPAGAVADLAARVIHPPAGIMRLPRVAGDLELVSNGAMMIYIGGDDNAIEYEYAEVIRRGDPPTPERARFAIPILNPESPLSYSVARGTPTETALLPQNELPIIPPADPPSYPPSYSEARGMLTENAPSPRNELMEVPEGAIIIVPPGDPLPLRANYMLTSNTAQSHLRLSQNSVMVLRAGLTAYMSGGASIAGPAYVRLGGTAENGRPVAANLLLNHANIQTSGRSFVMLSQPARMRPRPGARLDSPKTGIPAQARLDLFGNMEARADAWFFDEMLPSAAAETMRNHPMVYAVAPECRRASTEAEQCGGENFEGLTFEIPPGEEIALPHDIVAPERFRVESADGSDFRATLFYRDAPNVPVKGASVAYLRADENGRLSANSSGPFGFTPADLSENDNQRGRKFVVAHPPQNGLRVYLGLGAPPADPGARATERNGANYVEVRRPITIHSGGYVGDGYETNTDNIAQAELLPETPFALGAGTRPFDGGFRPGAFGKMSAATVRLGPGGVMAQVDLAEYVAVNTGWRPEHFFNYNVSLGAQMAQVDSSGRIESHYRAGDNLDAGPGGADEFIRTRAYEVSETGGRDALQLMKGQTLDMEPGYLWQGFIPAGGADLRFTRNDDLWRAYWPPSPESPEEALMQSRIYLRVHPADLALNFFGAGVETVEGLDGESAQTPARELLAMNEALFQDFAASDYTPPNLSERRLMGYRMTVRDSETELLAPYYENPIGAEERPYYVHLNTPGGPGDFSHGVNPDILHIPPALRHQLVGQHALRINSDGSYAPAGTLGDAEAFTYNAADPLFFANWIPFSGLPPRPPSFSVGPFTGEAWRRFTNLPADGLKVRRVRLGMDPLAARLAVQRPSAFASDNHLSPVLRDPAAEGGGQSRFEKISAVQTALDSSAKSLRLNSDPPRAGLAEATGTRNLVGTLCDPAGNLQTRFGQPAVPPPPFNSTVSSLHPNYPAANYDSGTVVCSGGGNDRDTLPACEQTPPADSGGGLLPCAPIGRGDHSAGYDALFALRISTDAAGAPLTEPFFLNPPVLAVVRETGTGRAVTVTTHWHNYYSAQADGTPTLAARIVWGGARAAIPLGANDTQRRMAAAPAHFQHILPFQTGQIDSPEFLHDQDWDWFAFGGENVDPASLTPDELPAAAWALRGAMLANAANTANSDDERTASMALADAILARFNGDPNWRAPLLALGYDGTPTGGNDGAFATFAYFGNLLYPPFNTSDRGEIYRVIASIPARADKTNLHVGILSGPFSHLAPDNPQNIAASGLNSSTLNGMCGVEDGDYLTVPFAPPPIQLASMDSVPGLAWPRPGREGGTFDLDKRIRGAFIPDANKPGLMHYLSPFQHERIVGGVPEFVSNPHENIRAQNRFQRGANSGEMELIPGGGYRAVPAPGIPMNRARAKHTTDPAADSTTPKTFADIAAGEEKTTRVYSELYVYMDRPHNPEYMGGEKQKFVIGADFRVEGAAAIVPPFAAARDQAAADIMAQRSKMMTDLFGLPPLGETYAKQISGGRCRGMNPCPAMWTRNDWAPVLAGIVAMDAVNMEITAAFPESDLMENIYFIQPQPEMTAQLADGTTTTLYAGSVIYPFSGKVIPAEALGADADLGIVDRSAVAAVDVSPAVAPTPVRIFREKTHLSDALESSPRPVPKRGEFHIRVEVLSETRPDGSAYIESETCPAFIPIVPDPAGPLALPNVNAAAAPYDTGALANRAVSIVADGGVPASRYPLQITLAQVRMQKGGGAPNHRGATLRYGFGGEIASVNGIIIKNTGDEIYRISDHDDPNADDGITIVVNNANPSANRIQVDFGKIAEAAGGIEPFDIVAEDSLLNPVNLTPNPPRALVYLQAGMNPDLCDGLVPPGTYDKSAVVRNDAPQDFQLQTDSYPPGFVARVPPRGHTPDYLFAAITISRELGLTEIPYQYSHDEDGVLGFNSETYAAAAARGPVPSTLRATEPLFAQLRAACPGCVFTEHDPMTGDPLRISVPISATLHIAGRNEARLFQSYDFAVQTPATVNILSQTFRSPLSAYKASNNPDLSGNLINAFYSPTNPDCHAASLGCRFLEGGIVQRQATAGGEQIVYLLEYNAPPDVHEFRVEELQVYEPDPVITSRSAERGRISVFVTDTTPDVRPPPGSSPAGAAAAFYITVSVVLSPVRYEAPLLPDGLDDDAAREDSIGGVRSHIFISGTIGINPDAEPPEMVPKLREWLVARAFAAPDNERAAVLFAMSDAILARRDGEADWYDALDSLGYGRGIRTGNDDAWDDFATASDRFGFATFDRDDPNELYRVISSIPVRSFKNTQSHGFAVLVRFSGEEFVRSVSGRWSGGVAEITVILEPVDRDGVLTNPIQTAPGGGALRFARHPTQLHGTQAEVMASEERVVLTLSRFAELSTTTPRGVLGTATIVVNNPPVNVGVDFVSDDRHYHLVRESHTASEAAAVGGGVSEFDFLRRRETPLASALGAAATLVSAGGGRHSRWHSSILGSEFHFAPVRAGVNGTLFSDFPPEAQAFWDELESRRIADEDNASLHSAMQRILEIQVNGGESTAREIESLMRSVTSGQRELIRNAAVAGANAAGIPNGAGAPTLLERIIEIYGGIPVGGVCVVEPLGFLPLYETEYERPDGVRFGGAMVTSRVAPVARLRWDVSDSEERGYYPGRFEVLGGNVNEVRRYDGGFARGFLATPFVAEALAAYYGGRDGWRGATMLASGRRFVEDSHVFSGVFSPYRPTGGTLDLTPLDDRYFQLWRVPMNLFASVPKANEHIRLRNPLSHMWQSRRGDAVHSEVLGVRRLHTARSHELTRQNICADPGTGAPQRENIYPDFCLNNQGADGAWEDSPYDFAGRGVDNYSRKFGALAPATQLMMMLNPDESFYAPRVRAPYIPMGVRLRSGAERDGRRPIRALRLPHAIETPPGRIEMPGRPRGYPDSAGKFFEFPAGSRALVMNVDMSSWESAHPGMAATRGGMSYRHRGSTVSARGIIGAKPAGAPGEAFDEFDVGGRRFLHYHRGESAPAEEPTSGRRIYANAWVKLNAPGVLRSGGMRTRLREGTVLNPIEGTFVRPPQREFRGNREAVLPYSSNAVAGTGAPLRLARAALILPKGAKLVVRRGGVLMRKVRAAVFFSPAPLGGVECGGRVGRVNQLERGGELGDGTVFTLGHPCAWLDEPENLDGDRVFVYSNRPRWNETRTRVVSNDRVGLLGGELVF